MKAMKAMKPFGIVIVTVLALVAGVSAQQTTPPPAKPDAKPEAKAPAAGKTLDGKWDMNITSDQGPMAIVATFKMDGTKLTGNLNSQMGDTALVGEFNAGKLKFTIQFDGGGGAMEIVFNGTMKDDGTLTGTLNGQMGEMNWTATRAKGL
jgi:hypothetical protein